MLFPSAQHTHKVCPFLLIFSTFCSPLQQELGGLQEELTKGRVCPFPVHVSPAHLAAAGEVGNSSPAQLLGVCLQKTAPTPSGSPSSTTASRVLKFRVS